MGTKTAFGYTGLKSEIALAHVDLNNNHLLFADPNVKMYDTFLNYNLISHRSSADINAGPFSLTIFSDFGNFVRESYADFQNYLDRIFFRAYPGAPNLR